MINGRLKEVPALDVFTGRSPLYNFKSREDLVSGALLPKGLPSSKYDFVSSKSKVLQQKDDRVGQMLKEHRELASVIGDSALNPRGDSVYYGDDSQSRNKQADNHGYGYNGITAFRDDAAGRDYTTNYLVYHGEKSGIEAPEKMFDDPCFIKAPSVVKAAVPDVLRSEYINLPYDSLTELLRNPDKTVVANDNYVDTSIPTLDGGDRGVKRRKRVAVPRQRPRGQQQSLTRECDDQYDYTPKEYVEDGETEYDRYSKEVKLSQIEGGDDGRNFYDYDQVLTENIPTNRQIQDIMAASADANKDSVGIMDEMITPRDESISLLVKRPEVTAEPTDPRKQTLEPNLYTTDLNSIPINVRDGIPLDDQIIQGAVGAPPELKNVLEARAKQCVDTDSRYNDQFLELGEIFSSRPYGEALRHNDELTPIQTYDGQPTNVETRGALDIPDPSINTSVYARGETPGMKKDSASMAIASRPTAFIDPRINDAAGLAPIQIAYEKAEPKQCLPRDVLMAKLLDNCAKVASLGTDIETIDETRKNKYKDEPTETWIESARGLMAARIREDGRQEYETKEEGAFKLDDPVAQRLFSDKIQSMVGTWVD